MTNSQTIASARRWVETVVVGLKLCPFANRALEDGQVRFAVTDAENEAELLVALRSELNLLTSDAAVETTLLIHPQTLLDFYDFNDSIFLKMVK